MNRNALVIFCFLFLVNGRAEAQNKAEKDHLDRFRPQPNWFGGPGIFDRLHSAPGPILNQPTGPLFPESIGFIMIPTPYYQVKSLSDSLGDLGSDDIDWKAVGLPKNAPPGSREPNHELPSANFPWNKVLLGLTFLSFVALVVLPVRGFPANRLKRCWKGVLVTFAALVSSAAFFWMANRLPDPALPNGTATNAPKTDSVKTSPAAKLSPYSRRLALAEAFAKQTDVNSFMPLLLAALKDENCFVRKAAAVITAEIGPDARDAVPTLLEELSTDGPDDLTFVKALAGIGKPAVEPLLATWRSDSSSTYHKRRAVQALTLMNASVPISANDLFTWMDNQSGNELINWARARNPEAEQRAQNRVNRMPKLGLQHRRECCIAIIEGTVDDFERQFPKELAQPLIMLNIPNWQVKCSEAGVLQDFDADFHADRQVAWIRAEEVSHVVEHIKKLRSEKVNSFESNRCLGPLRVLEFSGREAKEALPYLIQVMEAPVEGDPVLYIAKTMLKIDPSGVALAQVLQHSVKDEQIAVQIAQLLANIRVGHKAAIPVLRKHCARLEDSKDASQTLRGLALLNDDREFLLPHVWKCIESIDPNLRLTPEDAAICLSYGDSKAVVPYLIAALKEKKQPHVRAAILSAFQWLGPEARSAGPALIALCRSKNPYVCQAALRALIATRLQNEEVLKTHAQALERPYVNGANGELRLKGEPEYLIRALAAYGLSFYGERAASSVPQLIGLACDARFEMNLGHVHGNSLAVFDRIRVTAFWGKRTAFLALGNIGLESKDAAPMLVSCIQHSRINLDFALQEYAGRALVDIGESAIPAIIDARRKDPNNHHPNTQRLDEVLRRIGPRGTTALAELNRDKTK